MPDNPVLDNPVHGAPKTQRRPGGSRAQRGMVGAALAVVAGVGVVAVVASRTNTTSSLPALATPPRFVDESDTAGLDHRYGGDFEYFVGGGVATFDCDGDNSPDLFLAGGSEPAALYRNRSEIGGALQFERQASPVTDLTSVTGAYPLDVDSDDEVDIVVLRVGGNVVLRGLGDCRFEAATDQFDLDPGDDWTTAFSATWEGSNALPTLAFGNYLVPGREPGDTVCAASNLIRPTLSGDSYAPPLPLSPGYCTLSMLFSDWGRTGTPDLRVTNDRHYTTDGEEQLWRVAPDRPPRAYTEADGWRPLRIWGMGLASQDVTGDGYPEIFITSQADNKLQTLDGDTTRPTYRDIALRSGVTAQRPFTGGDVLPSTAWHPEFADVNNDGFIDLFVSKGNVEAQPDYAQRDPNNLLIGQPDGTFVEGAELSDIVDFTGSRGAALVDFNLDGMLDLVVVHRAANVGLWRNVGLGDEAQPLAMGHWTALRLRQPAPNVDAVGAWIEVRFEGHTETHTVTREVTVGGGHVGGQHGWIHVGTGLSDDAMVRVTWPDGTTGEWIPVPSEQFVTVERDTGTAVVWTPDG